jgi:hypothetical protein
VYRKEARQAPSYSVPNYTKSHAEREAFYFRARLTERKIRDADKFLQVEFLGHFQMRASPRLKKI